MKHTAITETDDIAGAICDARRNVALGRLSQFELECDRLGGMAARNPHRKQEVVDSLYDIATANSLLSIHGGMLIEQLIGAGLVAR